MTIPNQSFLERPLEIQKLQKSNSMHVSESVKKK